MAIPDMVSEVHRRRTHVPLRFPASADQQLPVIVPEAPGATPGPVWSARQDRGGSTNRWSALGRTCLRRCGCRAEGQTVGGGSRRVTAL